MLFLIRHIQVRFLCFYRFDCFVFFIATQIRTRSARQPNDLSTSGNNENPLNNNSIQTSDRKSTAASRRSVRSQKTIATSATDMSNTSSNLHTKKKEIEKQNKLFLKLGGSGPKRQPFQRLLTLVESATF